MIKAIVGLVFGFVLVIGGTVLSAIIKTNEPNSLLIDIFCMSQVVILGFLGSIFIEEWTEELKTRWASAKAKRHTSVRRF